MANPNAKEKTEPTSFRITREEKRQLAEIAAVMGISRAECVGRLIEGALYKAVAPSGSGPSKEQVLSASCALVLIGELAQFRANSTIDKAAYQTFLDIRRHAATAIKCLEMGLPDPAAAQPMVEARKHPGDPIVGDVRSTLSDWAIGKLSDMARERGETPSEVLNGVLLGHVKVAPEDHPRFRFQVEVEQRLSEISTAWGLTREQVIERLIRTVELAPKRYEIKAGPDGNMQMEEL